MRFFWMIASTAVCAVLAGCGHGHDDDAIHAGQTQSAAVDVLTPPANPNDFGAWRAFIGKVILAETHDANAHPYTFIVPAGDSDESKDTRKSMATAIHGYIGNTAVPENMVVLTGPESDKVAQVIVDAFGDLPARSAEGLVVMYVGVPQAATKAQGALRATGAQFRMKAMRASS